MPQPCRAARFELRLLPYFSMGTTPVLAKPTARLLAEGCKDRESSNGVHQNSHVNLRLSSVQTHKALAYQSGKLGGESSVIVYVMFYSACAAVTSLPAYTVTSLFHTSSCVTPTTIAALHARLSSLIRPCRLGRPSTSTHLANLQDVTLCFALRGFVLSAFSE